MELFLAIFPVVLLGMIATHGCVRTYECKKKKLVDRPDRPTIQ